MPHDDLDHIPPIVPSRDGAPVRGRSKSRAGRGKGERQLSPGAAGVGTGLLARLVMTVSLVIAGVACAWAWQLQTQLHQANGVMLSYAQRIGDLEARLSDTDEGMNQNAAVQAVKVAELESEVRKLWDNVWKESKARLGKLEAASTSQGKSIKGVEGSLSTVRSQLKDASGDIAKLKNVAGDLARLMSSARANQSEVERVADTLNRIDLELAKLDKRVDSNEQWLGSVNAFRKQVNTSLAELQATVRAMQSSP